jgi:hypothetical protein
LTKLSCNYKLSLMVLAESLRLALEVPTPIPSSALIEKVPQELTRRALIEKRGGGEFVPEKLWNKRGRAVEVYVRDILATQTEIVDHVDINEDEDAQGPDIRVFFKEGFPIPWADIEVKSSSHELRVGKQKIRDEMFYEEPDGQLVTPWAVELAATKWEQTDDNDKYLALSRELRRRRRILINGGEKDYRERTPEDILRNSFYPQLIEILLDVSEEQEIEELAA